MNAVELLAPDGKPSGAWMCGLCHRVETWNGTPALLPDPAMPWKGETNVLADHSEFSRQQAEHCCSGRCEVCGAAKVDAHHDRRMCFRALEIASGAGCRVDGFGDLERAVFEVDVFPFQRRDFGTAAAGDDRHADQHRECGVGGVDRLPNLRRCGHRLFTARHLGSAGVPYW